MKFRSLMYTFLSLIAVSSLTTAGVMAQTPAAPVVPQAAPAPANAVPQQPAPPAPTRPAPARPMPNMPPPPPANPEELPLPAQPLPASMLNAPGIEAILPSKIIVTGTAVTVNGQPISYQALVTKFIAAGGPGFLDELVNEQLIRQEAKKEGVIVSQKEVDAKLLEAKKYLLPQYPGKSWSEFLFANGRTESNVRDNLYDGLLAVGLVEKSPAFQNLGGKIHIYHILKLTTAVQGAPTPASDAAAKQEIENIRALIISGKATFQEEAKKESQDSSAASGGDLGWIGHDANLDPTFSNAAWALKEGEISEPVKSQYGYHLIYVARVGEHATKADIAQYLNNPQVEAAARKQLPTYLKQLRSKAKVVNYILQKPTPIQSGAKSGVVVPHPMVRMVPTPIQKPAAK